MPKNKNSSGGEKTSPKVASQAGKLLSDSKSSKAVKSVAASALTQAANKPKSKSTSSGVSDTVPPPSSPTRKK